MGTITEIFSTLGDVLLNEGTSPTAPRKHSAERELLLQRWLRPLLPAAVRLGPGTIFDAKDRHVGPLDVVASWEIYPPFGEGAASAHALDGVIFCLQARHWAQEDLTQFAKLAADIRKLDRRQARPVFCGAVSFDPLAMDQVLEFLRSPIGKAVDGVLSIGQNAVVRNSQGLYGDPERIPFVTERGGPEALKAFTLCLLQLAQSFLGLPFGLSDYQHL